MSGHPDMHQINTGSDAPVCQICIHDKDNSPFPFIFIDKICIGLSGFQLLSQNILQPQSSGQLGIGAWRAMLRLEVQMANRSENPQEVFGCFWSFILVQVQFSSWLTCVQ